MRVYQPHGHGELLAGVNSSTKAIEILYVCMTGMCARQPGAESSPLRAGRELPLERVVSTPDICTLNYSFQQNIVMTQDVAFPLETSVDLKSAQDSCTFLSPSLISPNPHPHDWPPPGNPSSASDDRSPTGTIFTPVHFPTTRI